MSEVSNRRSEPRMTSYEEDVARLELAATRRASQGSASRTRVRVVPRDRWGRTGRIDIRRDLRDLGELSLGVLYRLGLLALVLSPVILGVFLWKWLA